MAWNDREPIRGEMEQQRWMDTYKPWRRAVKNFKRGKDSEGQSHKEWTVAVNVFAATLSLKDFSARFCGPIDWVLPADFHKHFNKSNHLLGCQIWHLIGHNTWLLPRSLGFEAHLGRLHSYIYIVETWPGACSRLPLLTKGFSGDHYWFHIQVQGSYNQHKVEFDSTDFKLWSKIRKRARRTIAAGCLMKIIIFLLILWSLTNNASIWCISNK